MSIFRLRCRALVVPALASLVFIASATAQQPATAPSAPVTTGALPSRAAVPQKIDPIVPPAVVAPIARTRATTAAVATKRPACKSGERLQRKAGTCAPIAAAAKSTPSKAPAKVAKR